MGFGGPMVALHCMLTGMISVATVSTEKLTTTSYDKGKISWKSNRYGLVFFFSLYVVEQNIEFLGIWHVLGSEAKTYLLHERLQHMTALWVYIMEFNISNLLHMAAYG